MHIESFFTNGKIVFKYLITNFYLYVYSIDLIIKYFFNFKAVLDKTQHSISYTLSRTEAVIVEYVNDENTDMFQVIIIQVILSNILLVLRFKLKFD